MYYVGYQFIQEESNNNDNNGAKLKFIHRHRFRAHTHTGHGLRDQTIQNVNSNSDLDF